MAMTPDEQAIYDGLLGLIREQIEVINEGRGWGLTESQIDAAASFVASEVDYAFTYTWRPGRGPNYRPAAP